MKKLALIACLLLFSTAAAAQIEFDNGNECDGTANAARGCLKIEASTAAFVELRDALNFGVTTDLGGGNVEMTCTQCSVDKGITGCTAINDKVTKTDKQAALHRLACVLTSLRDQAALRDDVQAAQDAFVPGADIGNGNPG